MVYTSQELSDKMEIQELCFEYADAIDRKEFHRLDNVFTADALIDYSAMGAPKGSYAEIKAFLESTLPNFERYYHLNANMRIALDGDTATGKIMVLNPIELPTKDGKKQMTLLGLYYHDHYVRTDKGWRIKERREEFSWSHNVPDGLSFGD